MLNHSLFTDPFVTAMYGSESALAYVPQCGSLLQSNMNFLQRVQNTLLYGVNQAILKYVFIANANAFRAKHAPGVCSDAESRAKAALIILHMSFVIDAPRPLVPAMKVVGPILPEPGQPLPQVRFPHFTWYSVLSCDVLWCVGD